MGRLTRVLSAGVIGLATGWPSAVSAQAVVPASRSAAAWGPSSAAVRQVGGVISGTVSDERGGVLAGATVSMLGSAMTAARAVVTDAQGRFSVDRLPAGDYLIYARLQGFAASPREIVRVNSGVLSVHRLRMRRLEQPIGTTGVDSLTSRAIMAAGFDVPRADAAQPAAAAEAAGTKDDHAHTETAWRLRHLPRSILRDSTSTASIVEDEGGESPGSFFGRGLNATASLASSFFTDLPFSGEVNLLTTGALGQGALFSGGALPRGVAYLSIGAPTPAGHWSMRAAMSQGDLSSWIVAGSFVSDREGAHTYDLGFSHSTQEYQGGNLMALAAVSDGSRNVGEIYALDRWTVSPGVAIEYGGRYARYDYLSERGLFSPRAGFTLEPVAGTRVSATLAQRMVAPGAEEFLSPRVPGPWLPPERTFSPLGSGDLRVERARAIDLAFEHEVHAYVLGVRRFFQAIDNQVVTIFGMNVPGAPPSVGHYYVANAGAVNAQGWAVSLSTPQTQRLRASIDYSRAHAQWATPNPTTESRWAATRRRNLETVHDITTTLQADITETATRVFVLYKINSAYAGAGGDRFASGLDGRFDMQVNQALPFAIAGTKWEVLVGLRNLFRDPNDPASIFDELLVVRPPKRVVGGFLVRF